MIKFDEDHYQNTKRGAIGELVDFWPLPANEGYAKKIGEHAEIQ